MARVILDLCAGTGAWSEPYMEAGYDVRRITLPEDIRLLHKLPDQIHGILAAPPCTVFARSGARWPRTKEEIIDGLSVVDACMRAVLIYQPVWWALENPIGMLKRYIGPPAMYFQPWEYGDPYTKKTALWGRFTPPKKNPVEIKDHRIHTMAPGPRRSHLRAITPPGFARAFHEANP